MSLYRVPLASSFTLMMTEMIGRTGKKSSSLDSGDMITTMAYTALFPVPMADCTSLQEMPGPILSPTKTDGHFEQEVCISGFRKIPEVKPVSPISSRSILVASSATMDGFMSADWYLVLNRTVQTLKSIATMLAILMKSVWILSEMFGRQITTILPVAE